MNIQITQILEGGIDLNSLSELPRSLMLVHGSRATSMPITREQLDIIMSLISITDSPEKPALKAPQKQMPQKPVGTHLLEEDSPEEDPDSEYTDSETGAEAY